MAEERLDSLRDLFISELKDMLSAEKQTTESMPKMAQAASSPQVKAKFEQHLQQTKGQIDRLNRVFSMLNMSPSEKFCEGMAGIIKDGQHVLEMQGDPNVKDAALIAAAQKVEHYEIASYGTLRTFAQTLGMNDIARELQTTLGEESATDKMLSEIAERSINKKAA